MLRCWPLGRDRTINCGHLCSWIRCWLHKIRQPTLILAGDDDPIIPLVNMKLLAWRIPNSELHVIDDGHLFLVTRAQSVAPLIMGFLAEERQPAVIRHTAALKAPRA